MRSKWTYRSSKALVTLTCAVLATACADAGGSGAAPANGGAGATGSAGRAGSGGIPESGGTADAGAVTGTAGSVSVGGEPASGSSSGGTGIGASGAPALSTAGASASGGSAGSTGAAGASNHAGTDPSGGGAGTANPVASDDSFDGTTLDSSWTVFHPDLADLTVAGGSLSITPHSGAIWYQASQADLVYKLVTGDFKATTTVHARKASNPTLTPAQFADVGGIMARNPSGSSENYVLGVVGYAEMNQLAVEHKSTTNGLSVYGEVAFTPDAEFRLCRVGSTFTIYYRHPGDTVWGPAFSPFERPDLPATVQVGAIAYTGANSPDFVAIFDDFSFEPLGAGCTQ